MMPTELKMPALSPTMEKATLARWLVREGDDVKPGDLLAEIETDKATMDLEAVDAGRVARLVLPEGTENVAVGAVIALIGAAGEGEGAADRGGNAAELALITPAPVAAASAPVPAPAPQRIEAALPAILAPSATSVPQEDRVRISPLARRIAHERELDVAAIKGTGPGGRIICADLGLPVVAKSAAPPSPVPVAQPPFAQPPFAQLPFASPPAGVPVETVRLDSMRKTIARRLSESKQTVPHFYLTARCNLDPLLALRQSLNADLAGRGVRLSVNDLLMKALAIALIEVPDANVQYGGDVLHRFGRVDIAMAVAIEGGLVTPVIRGVDSLSLSAIADQSKALAAKARAGKLLPEDYQGGTVSLSNLGMFGIDEMVPVINPPQALILGVAAGVRQPWDVGGEIQLATILAATASFDHRAIDGAAAAQFMQALRHVVEHPLMLLA